MTPPDKVHSITEVPALADILASAAVVPEIDPKVLRAYRRESPDITEPEAVALLAIIRASADSRNRRTLALMLDAYRAGIERGRELELLNQRNRLDALAENPE
jgi:hypothetical protein